MIPLFCFSLISIIAKASYRNKAKAKYYKRNYVFIIIKDTTFIYTAMTRVVVVLSKIY